MEALGFCIILPFADREHAERELFRIVRAFGLAGGVVEATSEIVAAYDAEWEKYKLLKGR